MEPVRQCQSPCIHGQCFYYINDPNTTFCQCQPGWSGTRCDVEYKCDCASRSLCISGSICLCPRYRVGPRCHLIQTSCHSESCKNGGQCIAAGVRQPSKYQNESMCICPEGYVGGRCEHRQRQTQIEISFHHKLTIPPLLLIHFFGVQYRFCINI